MKRKITDICRIWLITVAMISKEIQYKLTAIVKHHFRDVTRYQIWKLPHQDRGCVKLNIYVCRIKFLLTALARDSRTVGNVRVTSRGSCECTFVAPGSITGSSSVLVCRARPRVYYMLHTQGMRFSRARLGPHAIFHFSSFVVTDEWATTGTHWRCSFRDPSAWTGPKVIR